MIETTNPIFAKPWAKTAARIAWGVLLLATLYVCYFSHLGALGFVGPDEPRYAWIARDMAETGDWVTPRLYGKPWFEKPVLYYWGAALSFKLFGVSEAAARLPSAISALLATLALAWLAWRLYGSETARWLLLLLPTTVGMIGFSHAAATDMPFSGMLTFAMVCAAVVIGITRSAENTTPPRTPWLALGFFGFFLGVAVLAKGPAAIILSGGAVFFWALFTKRWRDAFRLFHPAAIAAFCLTALPWYILCARRNPDFFRIFIIEHNFKRYLTPEFQHIQPFWFYGPILLAAFLPWTAIFLWTAITGLLRLLRERKISASAVFFLSWTIFCVAFFSLSKSKLPGYVLPAVPAIGVLLARSCTSLAAQYRKSFGATLFGFALLLFGVSELLSRGHLHASKSGPLVTELIALVMLCLCVPNIVMSSGFACTDNKLTRSLLATGSMLPILLLLLFANRLVPDFIKNQISARSLADQIQVQRIAAGQIHVYRVHRSWHYALNFYLHNELKEWDQNPASAAYVLSDSYGCRQFRTNGYECADVPLGISAWGWKLSQITPKFSAGEPARSGQTK